MFPSIMICPATCELCGQWMPGHSNDCPRSGVHPSQWTLKEQESVDITDEEETFLITTRYWSPTRNMTLLLED
ncbi:hypothetical protein BD770DRAFT_342574 [Pilaira anomala]|nr:hypothetical protein BD770DRAFT_342574 [Pilaira anomala]